MLDSDEIEIRVRYAETDRMGFCTTPTTSSISSQAGPSCCESAGCRTRKSKTPGISSSSSRSDASSSDLHIMTTCSHSRRSSSA